jgi:hypothetical protein
MSYLKASEMEIEPNINAALTLTNVYLKKMMFADVNQARYTLY